MKPNNCLFGVRIGGVYPPQCVTVSDSESYAYALAEHLRAECPEFGHLVSVFSTREFWPNGYTEADSGWLASADRFQPKRWSKQ